MLGMAFLATLGTPDGSSAKTKKGKKKRGPAGPPGPQGPTGTNGSAPAVSIVRGPAENFSVSTGGVGGRFSLCPGTSLAISRRINIGNARCGILDDAISVDGGGWAISLQCPAGESSSFNVVEVICLA
jgi:hypothetical protein